MTKQKILLFIPLLINGGLLNYTWSCILFVHDVAQWQHYVATVLFIIPAVMFSRNFKLSVLATGCFLVLGSINLLALTPWIETSSFWIEIKPVKIGTPKLQLLSFLLLILFCALNFKTLVDMYLDYKGYKDEQATEKP
jgi:hypothetical protein